MSGSLVGMNTMVFLPLFHEGLLAPFGHVRVGYYERAFTPQFLPALHHSLQILSALQLKIVLWNEVTVSPCFMQSSLLVNIP